MLFQDEETLRIARMRNIRNKVLSLTIAEIRNRRVATELLNTLLHRATERTIDSSVCWMHF